jgi:hypothetical protein
MRPRSSRDALDGIVSRGKMGGLLVPISQGCQIDVLEGLGHGSLR